ncbi:hypothetical protein N0V91_009554 [Didymella pomorum]|uniref:Rhodopsin domain-containing protein n=1 Tax=Didymella pomorum TaxID=749634 RepID=A0A9W9D4C9_9PLEO|nr:hypothetical protein N0V91_009554 [Didymella pomorum]
MVDASLQTLAYAVAYATFGIGLSTVLLRVYCRHCLMHAWGSDDNVALFVGQLRILKILFVEEVYYYFVHCVIKSAFFLFYLRLSPDVTFRRLVYIGMATNVAIFTVNILIACLQCIPFDEVLHPGTHADAKCLPKLVLLIVPSILNIFEDIYILVLPISTVLNLQMSTRRKIAVLSVISFGASAVLVACFRLIPLFELNSSPDVSYVLGKMVIVAAVEIQLAIIAVNLPSLKALWNKVTGGSSAGSKPSSSRSKSYKMWSLKSSNNRVSRGSITRMEHNVKGTESEEELWKQAGARQAAQTPESGITVTREVDMTSERRRVPQ